MQQEINKLLKFVNSNRNLRVQIPVNNVQKTEVLDQAQLPPPANFQRKNRSLPAEPEPPRGPVENETYLEPSSEFVCSVDTSPLENNTSLQMSTAVAADDYDLVLLTLMDAKPFQDT